MVHLFYLVSFILIIVALSLVYFLKKASETQNNNVQKQCQNISFLFLLLGALELTLYEYVEIGVLSKKIKVNQGFFNFIHAYADALDICLFICLFMFFVGVYFSFFFSKNPRYANIYANKSIRLFFLILDFFIIFYLVAGIIGLLN